MLLKDQFLIKEESVKKREEFYNEMYKLGYRDNLYHKSKETIINNKFPFLVEPNNKKKELRCNSFFMLLFIDC